MNTPAPVVPPAPPRTAGGRPVHTAPCLPATPRLGPVSRADHEHSHGQAVETVEACPGGNPVRLPGP
ncbi:hypothetical protein GCM10009549_46680 [Streptomyces thermoalcalitolerans]|uniref:Uncharacterized protein n=1 Tax=Streptomyces thermoalcalitolerans TaxID=65605 RepID=A0ABN1PAY7_9ACTN